MVLFRFTKPRGGNLLSAGLYRRTGGHILSLWVGTKPYFLRLP